MSQMFDEAIQFTDEVTGELLNNGYAYFGQNGLDAKLNPAPIFPDRELSGTQLANPQRTGPDGRLLNKVWIAGKYSLKIEDSANVQKYNQLENGFDEAVGNTLLINSLGVNDVVVNGSPTVTTLIDSQTYIFTAPADNTGAMTLKIDNTAIMPLKIRHDQALASGDIKQDQKIVVVANLTDSVYEVVNDLSGVTLNGVETLTNKTLTSPVINSGVLNTAVSGTAILDEDDLVSDSDTQLATQQSIKAYIGNLRSNHYEMVYDGFNDAIIVNPGGWSVVRGSTGNYTVTHSLAGADTRKILTHIDVIQNSVLLVVTHTNLTGNTLSISVKNQSTLVNANGVVGITLVDHN